MALNSGLGINFYDIGDDIRLEVNFKIQGVLTDPTAVTLKIALPDGTTQSYTYGVGGTIVKGGVGNYYAIFNPAISGRYLYRFSGTGVVNASDEEEFRVPPRLVP